MAQTKTKGGIKYKKTTGKWFRAGGQSSQGGGLSHVTPADVVRLGPDIADLKRKTSPKQWAQIVNAAHRQGWTVASALDAGTPAALKQRTDVSLRKAAGRQVKEAYDPAYAELDTAGAAAGGLRQKRLADQSSFDQWAAQRASEQAGQINAAQQKYFDTIKQSSDAQIAQAQQTAATFAPKAGAGGISDLSGSTAQASVTRGAQASQAAANAAADRAAADTPVAAERAAAIPTAALGSAYKRHAEIEGDYSKTISDLGTQRIKLNTDRAAAQIRAYSDLLKTEMDKASSNRDFAGLQSQILSKEQIAKLQDAQYRLGIKTKIRNADVAAATTRHGQSLSHSDRLLQISSTATQKSLDRANRLAVKRAGDKSKATGPAARKASRAQVQGINSLADMIRRGVIIGPDGKRHKATRANLMGILGATKGQIDVAVRITQGRKHTLYNPASLGILPEDAGLLR